MVSFDSEEIMAILVYTQISSNSYKNEVTNNLFTYKLYMYIHLNVCKVMADVKLLLLHSSFKNVINKLCVYKSYLIYMYKQDLALHNLQGLICHKPQLNK